MATPYLLDVQSRLRVSHGTLHHSTLHHGTASTAGVSHLFADGGAPVGEFHAADVRIAPGGKPCRKSFIELHLTHEFRVG